MDFRNRKKIKLSEMTDEQTCEFMESVETGEEADFSSDDDMNDPDFEPNEISPEDERYISEVVHQIDEDESAFLNKADNFSLNLSAIKEDLPSTSPNEEVEEASGEEEPSTSTPRLKPPKRARSPLPEFDCSGPFIVPSSGGFSGTAITKDSAEFSKIIWRKRSMCLHVNEVAFRGDSSLPSSIKELETPMEIFRYFFTKKMVDKIVLESNRTARNVDINSKFITSGEEIYKYIGIHVYMSIYRYPNLESYWGPNAFQPIAKTMPKARFMAIKQYLSFRDENTRAKKGEPGYDALFRIRTLSNFLNTRFDSVPKTARLCVDEQMCGTKI
ncbi:piggyBac transposable element-derived protein 4-like isoform X2 [Bactrocera dorsalis]|uniref:PiggyBac transposable element-derived protein 4-like isoform X2 n=1 Tax=Bactrocera dorsalis TaxID=27457 RepID=A0ABM3J6Z4_BACDO|nr:piggyBac transposable element-derived protein 4-like isoform X2 [Bactrocera dorsalis]